MWISSIIIHYILVYIIKNVRVSLYAPLIQCACLLQSATSRRRYYQRWCHCELINSRTNSKILLQTRSIGSPILDFCLKVYLDGYHGDTSETFLIGEVDEVGRRLVETARRCRDEAIAACRPGEQLCVIGNTIRYTRTTYTHSEYLCIVESH